MRIELNGYVITKLQDGRVYVVDTTAPKSTPIEFIVDDVSEALEVINA